MEKGGRKEFDHHHRCVGGSGRCLYTAFDLFMVVVLLVFLWCFGGTFVILGVFFPLFFLYRFFVISFIH